MLLLRCPRCKHEMRFMPLKPGLEGKSKVCVYCGRSFSVKPNILKKIIS